MTSIPSYKDLHSPAPADFASQENQTKDEANEEEEVYYPQSNNLCLKTGGEGGHE